MNAAVSVIPGGDVAIGRRQILSTIEKQSRRGCLVSREDLKFELDCRTGRHVSAWFVHADGGIDPANHGDLARCLVLRYNCRGIDREQ
jgi:hypothetical protein